MIRHMKVTVKGKVQGVFFRTSAQAFASKLNLNGFVRNNHNGDVYLEAEGREEDIQKLVDWCAIGSAKAEVDEVLVFPGDLKHFTTFEVKR